LHNPRTASQTKVRYESEWPRSPSDKRLDAQRSRRKRSTLDDTKRPAPTKSVHHYHDAGHGRQLPQVVATSQPSFRVTTRRRSLGPARAKSSRCCQHRCRRPLRRGGNLVCASAVISPTPHVRQFAFRGCSGGETCVPSQGQGDSQRARLSPAELSGPQIQRRSDLVHQPKVFKVFSKMSTDHYLRDGFISQLPPGTEAELLSELCLIGPLCGTKPPVIPLSTAPCSTGGQDSKSLAAPECGLWLQNSLS